MEVFPSQLDALNLLQDGILAFARAERQGIRVDVDYCLKKQKHLTRKIDLLKNEFSESNFFKHWKHIYKEKTNIDSDTQLAHILYDIKKIKPVKFTPKGRGSTDEEALLQLNLPEISTRIQIGKLQKIKDYLDNFHREQVDGYLHPFYNLHIAITYRSSCDHPNFQNIPKRDYEAMAICRRALLARPGHLLAEIDFSGIEVKVSACYHKDPNMLRYINDETTDMHRDLCKLLFFLNDFDKKIPGHKYLRDATKNGFTFPEFYGSYFVNCANNLACTWGKLKQGKWESGQGVEIVPEFYLSDLFIQNGIKSYSDFVSHVESIEKDFWEERFNVYKQWKDQRWREYQRDGYFDSYTGFRFSGVMSKKDVTNYPIQCSAFHCNLWSFIQVDHILWERNFDSKLIGQIHDSMILDIHPDEMKEVLKIVHNVTTKKLLKHFKWICVPMEVECEVTEVDKPWSEKKEYKLVA